MLNYGYTGYEVEGIGKSMLKKMETSKIKYLPSNWKVPADHSFRNSRTGTSKTSRISTQNKLDISNYNIKM